MALYKVQSPYNAALQGMQGASQTTSSMTRKQEVEEGKKNFGGALGSMVAGGGLGLGAADMFSGGEASKAMWAGLKGAFGGAEAGSAGAGAVGAAGTAATAGTTAAGAATAGTSAAGTATAATSAATTSATAGAAGSGAAGGATAAGAAGPIGWGLLGAGALLGLASYYL